MRRRVTLPTWHEGPRQHDAHGRRDEAVGGLDRIGVGQTRPDPREGDSINAVVTTITKVADQTNLLSIKRGNRGGEGGGVRPAASWWSPAKSAAWPTRRRSPPWTSRRWFGRCRTRSGPGVMQMDKFADEVRHGVGQVTKINQMTYEIITEVAGVERPLKLVNEGMRNQSLGAEQINDANGPDRRRRSPHCSVDPRVRGSNGSPARLGRGVEQEIGQFKI